MRDEFDEKFPGARQKWDDITGTEKQLRDLRDKAKQLQTRPASGLTGKTTVTNLPATRVQR